MKKRISLVIIVMFVVMVFASCGDSSAKGGDVPVGDIINIVNVDGAATSSSAAAPEMVAVEGQTGWSYQLYSDATVGADFYVYDIKANATEFPIHDGGPGVWLTYIVKGSGDVVLGDQDGNATGQTAHYEAGDYVIFQPNTFHGWKPSNEDTVLVFSILQAAG